MPYQDAQRLHPKKKQEDELSLMWKQLQHLCHHPKRHWSDTKWPKWMMRSVVQSNATASKDCRLGSTRQIYLCWWVDNASLYQLHCKRKPSKIFTKGYRDADFRQMPLSGGQGCLNKLPTRSSPATSVLKCLLPLMNLWSPPHYLSTHGRKGVLTNSTSTVLSTYWWWITSLGTRSWPLPQLRVSSPPCTLSSLGQKYCWATMALSTPSRKWNCLHPHMRFSHVTSSPHCKATV